MFSFGDLGTEAQDGEHDEDEDFTDDDAAGAAVDVAATGSSGGGGGGGTTGNSSAGHVRAAISSSERAQRRLERNRESARASRARKKDYLTHLHAETTALFSQLGAASDAHCAALEGSLDALCARVLALALPVAQRVLAADAVAAPAPASAGRGRRRDSDLAAAAAAGDVEESDALAAAVRWVLVIAGPASVERQRLRRLRFYQLRRVVLSPCAATLLSLAFLAELGDGSSNSSSGGGGGGSGGGAVVSGGNSGSGTGFVAPLLPLAPFSLDDAAPAASSAASVGAAAAGGLPDEPPTTTLWAELCGELALTREQADCLHDQLRRVAAAAGAADGVRAIEHAVLRFSEIEIALGELAARAQAELERIAGILSPAQMIIFLVFWLRHG